MKIVIIGGEGTIGDGDTRYHVTNSVIVIIRQLDSVGRVLDAAIEAGAEDVAGEGDEFIVTCELVDFAAVQQGIKDSGIEPSSAELTMIPKNEVSVAGKDAEKLVKLLEVLEDLDDVQKVHSNADIDEAVLAEAV